MSVAFPGIAEESRLWKQVFPRPEPVQPASSTVYCPPEFIVRLACLKPDDDILIAHMSHCEHCSDIYAAEAAGLTQKSSGWRFWRRM